MTITTQQSQVTLLGNGSTTVFSFPFVGVAAGDISVIYQASTTAQPVTLSPSQYTLNLNAPVAGALWGVGGTVTYPTSGPAIPNGSFLTILRTLPLTQATSITNQDNLYPQVIEQGLDVLEMQIQQIAAGAGQFRGTWVTSVNYNLNDVVIDGANGSNTSNYYACAIANLSGTWTTDLANGDWNLAINVASINANVAAAAASATSASSSASAAASSATTASTQASNASTSATAAAGSATNAATSATNAAGYAAALSGTSTSSVAIGTGSHTFTTQSGKQWINGQFLQIASNATPANYMHGQVTSYTGTTLVVNVTDTGGSGTDADWNISISGTQGPMGAVGASINLIATTVLPAPYGTAMSTVASDNSTAFNNLLAYGAAQGIYNIYIPPGTYAFTMAPAAITGPFVIFGNYSFAGSGTTVLSRNYTPSSAAPFIDIQNAEVALRGLSIFAATGTTLGYAIRCVTGSSSIYDFCTLDHLYVSGTGTWERCLHIDGSARSGGLGLRDWFINNCKMYQATDKLVYLKTAVDLDWIGGGAYATAGSPSFHFQIDGATSVLSTNVNIKANFVGNVGVSWCNGAHIDSPVCTSITVDSNSYGTLSSGSAPTISNGSTLFSILSGKALQIPQSLAVGPIPTGFGPLSVTENGTAPSGTGNSYGLSVTPQSNGEILVDALNGSTSSALFGLRTYNNGTYNKWALDASGQLTLPTGGGIKYGNVASPSSTTLSYYAEGTWTPTLVSWTTTGTVVATGKYTRIGRTVFFQADIAATTVACTAGTSTVTGLPFTPSDSYTAHWASSNTGLNPGNALVTSGGSINTISQSATGSTLTVSGFFFV